MKDVLLVLLESLKFKILFFNITRFIIVSFKIVLTKVIYLFVEN